MEALRFTGSGSEYFKIWIVNVLLTIITLGIYYPWAKVRNKRYFYANSNLADRNFEYHATGKQLFIGFLIAVGIFIVFQIVSQISPIASIVLIIALFIAIPWIIWRSLMFNMRVTSFSNVHFGFKGKLKQAYINFFVYPFLLIVLIYGLPLLAAFAPMIGVPETLATILSFSLILILPAAFYLFAFIKKINTEYIINGSRYGQGIFEASVETKKFMMINLKTLGISVLVLLVMGILAALFGGGMEILATFDTESFEQGQLPEGLIGILALGYFFMLIGMIFIMAFSITRQRTYVYANTKLDDEIAFESTLRARDFAWVMLSNMLLVIVTLGLAMPWAKVRMAKLMLENTLVDTSTGFDEYINQKQDEESSLGEQIGDAFDVDVGVAF
ncbi:MAG: Thymidylate kinase (EC [uncultured Sulfurovum sp.]|uniref:Thymidylate kinase (EC) n=1 Tax=uncultured Sulfurovum sp. TaxID=269237 RepID=A0A6S6SR11_9BACT|nr:MAG: Thymidylate kinase (EC [uncultured Sulfurovum sp.]